MMSHAVQCCMLLSSVPISWSSEWQSCQRKTKSCGLSWMMLSVDESNLSLNSNDFRSTLTKCAISCCTSTTLTVRLFINRQRARQSRDVFPQNFGCGRQCNCPPELCMQNYYDNSTTSSVLDNRNSWPPVSSTEWNSQPIGLSYS